MNNNTDLLQYHIDRKLKRVSPNVARQLNSKQIARLQSQLDLHYKLTHIAVKKSRGYSSLEQALRNIDASTKAKPWYMNLRLQIASVSVVALFSLVVIGGVSLFGSTQTTTSNLSQSSVVANGSVDNLNNLNLLDAQNDIKVSSADDTAVSAAQAELSSTSKLDEVVNESF